MTHSSKIARELDGEVRQVMSMKQNKDNLAAGRITVEGLEDMALVRFYPKRLGREAPVIEQIPTTDADTHAAQEADAEQYRQGQRDKLYKLHDFGEEDETVVDMLVDLAVEQRRLRLDLKREKRLPYRQRLEMTKELRQLASDYDDLQKSLGIDRQSRTSPTAGDEWLRQYHEQLVDGASYVKRLRAEGEDYAARATSEAEVWAYMQHTSGLPHEWAIAFLEAHRRVLGLPAGVDMGLRESPPSASASASASGNAA